MNLTILDEGILTALGAKEVKVTSYLTGYDFKNPNEISSFSVIRLYKSEGRFEVYVSENADTFYCIRHIKTVHDLHMFYQAFTGYFIESFSPAQ